MEIVDLHVHSNRSDGTFTPAGLVDYAMEKGLAAFALTDHDTIDGVEEAILRREELKKAFAESRGGGHTRTGANAQGGIFPRDKAVCPVPEVIPGIEFSTEYQGRDIHIVGLFIDYKSPVLLRHLKAFVDSRDTRNQKMCRLLTRAGIPVTYEALLEEFPGAVITRAHYAKYMLNHGYIKTLQEAFERYIGDGCPCYVSREKVTPVQAVKLILCTGGVPVLAHPVLYHLEDRQLELLISELKEAGLMGIEAVYSTYTQEEEGRMRTLAARHGLLISGGSDFHGSNKPGLDLAVGYGKLFIPGSILEEIKKAAGL